MKLRAFSITINFEVVNRDLLSQKDITLIQSVQTVGFQNVKPDPDGPAMISLTYLDSESYIRYAASDVALLEQIGEP